MVRTPAAKLYRIYPQSEKRSYKTTATFDNALPFLIREGWIDAITVPEDVTEDGAVVEPAYDAALALSSADAEYATLLTEIPRLMNVDFSPLRGGRPGYATQAEIPQERVDMFGAAFLHYGDLGLVARYVGGEYLGDWRDGEAILSALDPILEDAAVPAVPDGLDGNFGPTISQEDRDHIERILNLQAPAEFNWEEPAQHKAAFLRRGNSPTVAQHAATVTKTLNKEERNHHLMPFPGWVGRFSNTARHVQQTILVKNGKKARLIWNGTAKRYSWEYSMNEVTPTEKEAPITFGYVYLAFCVWLWNLRISYPNEEIYLAFIDISSCFRWPRIAPDLVGAFGFVMGSIYFAANAMVFGSVVSASTWEPFRRAIAALATSYYFSSGLVRQHWSLLQLVQWDSAPGPGVRFARARRCGLNPGVFRDDGTRMATPHFIYVDDNLLADIRAGMFRTLAAAAQAIFTVLGFPAEGVRQCAVALDKWKELFVSYKLVLLGLEFNTREMTVSIPHAYRLEVCALLNDHWHRGRRSFTINEVEALVGKLGRIGQAFRPMYHLMGSLYKSVAFCLNKAEAYKITVSRDFRALLRRSRTAITDDTSSREAREIRFAAQQAARQTHGSKQRFHICRSMREELDFLTTLLNDFSIPLSTFIGHIVPREPDFVAAGDACPWGGGGWSTDLRFWWHMDFATTFSDEIVRRASKGRQRDHTYISINVLETVVVIVNYAAALCACHVDGVNVSACPVLLNYCDNTSACSWINKKCRDSLLGRRLGRVFAGLMWGREIGVQCEWLSTHDNEIADRISRVKHESGAFDYSLLLAEFPQLQCCRTFHPSETLLSMISNVLEGDALPDPLMIRRLTPQMLGSFSS
mmetsp:Transcript_38437/g.92017  ORF Transcript_38437/g.92017 Transcript_38437/m.92017 type:complete len:864 (+) Transcript_38437:1-2592(+)